MRLKSLELIGFKSFPDKTVLNIENGVTVVVGPNGSGKSNISDAIRWVLGELSAKNVRGSKMEDVIFSGSNTRKPMNYAEVSLIIDNDMDMGAGHLNTDFSEVVVTRRCYRSGESEYQINRKNCRLKDIANLFMNTGVGKTGYSIIGQGKIADIISQKSEERRAIFEEAAGISRYRSQKNESERKLISVDDNLIRINDILSELNGRIEPLRIESERARQYLDLYEKKKRVDVSLALFDLNRLKEENEKSEKEYITAQEMYNIADDQLNDLQNRNDRLFDQAQQKKLEAQKLLENVNDDKEKLHVYQSEAMLLKNDIEHEKSQIEISNSEEGARKAKLEEARAQIKEQNEKREEIFAVLSEKAFEKEELISKYNKLSEERTEIEKNQSRLADSIKDSENAVNSIKLDIASKESFHSGVNERKEKIEKDIASSNESLGVVNKRVEKANDSINNYNKQIDELNKVLDSSAKELNTLKEGLEKLNEELETMQLEKRSKEQRIENLQRMDELFEGFQASVKNVMRAHESGRLTGITGPVSKVISVKPKYALAIETALGSSIQNIIVNDEKCAKEAIRYLRDTNGGRATFYPMSSIEPTHQIRKEDVKGTAGLVGIASDLVEYDSKYNKVIEYLLAHILVFDNLDSAAEYEKKIGYKTKVVTLDGQQINAGGSFTGGSSKKDSGLLTRKNEIANLQKALVDIEVSINTTSKEIEKINSQIKDIESADKDKTEKLAIFQRLCNAENTQLQVLKSQLELQGGIVKDLENQLQLLNEDDRNANDEIEEKKHQLEEKEKYIIELRTEAEKEEENHKALGAAISKVNNSITDINIKLAELSKDIENINKTLEFATEKENAANEDILKATSQNEKRLNAISEYETKIESLQAEAQGINQAVLSNEEKINQVNSEAAKKDEELASLRNKIKEQQLKRDELFRVYNKLENKRNMQNSEVEKITSKLWDDYELTYTTAKELQYPPVTEETRKSTATAQGELRGKIKALGNVNISSVEEYEVVCERHKFLTEQVGDLEKSRTELTNVIAELEREMCVKFSETIDVLNVSFNKVFCELFGGGKAELKLTDPSDVLNCGIEINVAPPGKIIHSLSLLSGGEQSFVAIALLFAILNVNPTPFCVLDEIEAALDELNVARFAEYAKRYSDHTQFIIITHRRGSMERGDTIYGVTMPQRGISKVISLNVNEVEEKLNIKL